MLVSSCLQCCDKKVRPLNMVHLGLPVMSGLYFLASP